MKILTLLLSMSLFGLVSVVQAQETLTGGFKMSEAKEMIDLAIDLNGTGISEKPTPSKEEGGGRIWTI